MNSIYLFLLSPLHTGGTTQEGNLVGIAREAHTELPYLPSSTIRGRLRASINDKQLRVQLFGPELSDLTQRNGDAGTGGNQTSSASDSETTQSNNNSSNLEQGDIWVGDGSLLWFPIASLSHGVVWISCPMLLRRWARLQSDNTLLKTVSSYDRNSTGDSEDENNSTAEQPTYRTNLIPQNSRNPKAIYLKDAIIKDGLQHWPDDEWKQFVPEKAQENGITRILLVPDRHFATLIQMGLWRQVKIKLDEHKTVDGGFRYEEAIPSDALMYFPWGVTSQVKALASNSTKVKAIIKKRQELADQHNIPLENRQMAAVMTDLFQSVLEAEERKILQIGGQESLGRGFVEQWHSIEQPASQPTATPSQEEQKS
ncbi:type III-B CRISPR module RAMP protein Cmr4 [Lusitaniella coriacea]|uniref:type III-B CRISPR module RAMP protein Cmr4 n=1 Tax=Lusitaniella coriacea TaxID=1983105 RepID=UPI003CF48C49